MLYVVSLQVGGGRIGLKHYAELRGLGGGGVNNFLRSVTSSLNRGGWGRKSSKKYYVVYERSLSNFTCEEIKRKYFVVCKR